MRGVFLNPWFPTITRAWSRGAWYAIFRSAYTMRDEGVLLLHVWFWVCGKNVRQRWIISDTFYKFFVIRRVKRFRLRCFSKKLIYEFKYILNSSMITTNKYVFKTKHIMSLILLSTDVCYTLSPILYYNILFSFTTLRDTQMSLYSSYWCVIDVLESTMARVNY